MPVLSVVDNTNYTLQREFFESKKKDVIFYGGSGSGKSYSVVDKLIINIFINESQSRNIKMIIARKTLPSLKKSVLPIFTERSVFWGIEYKLNKQDMIAKIGKRSEIYFVTMNNESDYEKIKSITNIDFIWIEEANELTTKAYDTLKLRLRNGKGRYAQFIMTFNPISTSNWIYTEFFEKNNRDTHKICVNIDQNKYADPEYVKLLDSYKNINEELYNVYRWGKWGTLKGAVYSNYTIVDTIPVNYNEVFYGLDFGYSNDPTSILKIYRKADEFYIQEICYESGLMNPDIVSVLKENNVKKTDYIFADSSEPKSIDEIKIYGFNIHPALKGPDSIRNGIQYIQKSKIFIHSDSVNVIRELQQYMWRMDKNGKSLNEPIDMYNHSMDAMRYGIVTRMKQPAKRPAISSGRANI